MAAAAGITAGASILSGALGGKGAARAAKVQAAAYQKGIDEQTRQFNVTQQNFQPFLQAGQAALGGVGDLLGLNGSEVQGSSIDALKASPAFTSLYDTGADTILQNASATGGLRGGNTQNSLAQFGSGLLGTLIQNQLGNLGGLVSTGAGATGNLASVGQNTANSVSSLLGQQGGANALSVAAPYAGAVSAINGLGSIAGGLAGGGNAASNASIFANSPTLQTLGSGGLLPGFNSNGFKW